MSLVWQKLEAFVSVCVSNKSLDARRRFLYIGMMDIHVPKRSMYAIYMLVNVGIYGIRGASGIYIDGH